VTNNAPSLMNLFNFFSPSRIMLGVGAAREVGRVAKSLGGRRAVIVTDRGVAQLGIADEIKQHLLSAGMDVEVFDRVELEPPAGVVDGCASYVRQTGFDIIVGVGGGSSLDTAKLASVMATNEGRVLDYVGFDRVPRRGIPKILLPTTAGSGAETTRVGAITDESDNTKRAVYTTYNLPDVALLDPLLTLSLPARLTAETGIDALSHAVESFVSFIGTPFSDLLALEAIRLVGKNLPAAYAKGEHVEARSNMLLASALAGLAMGSGRTGATHGLAFILESEFHMPHAKAISIMLPHVMKYNHIASPGKYGLIARALGDRIDGLSEHEAAKRSVVSVKNLLQSVNVSWRLAEHGLSADDLPVLVKGGFQQAAFFVPNPRNLSEDDVRNIYVDALE
jgi:alcohol dehydrogenase